MTVQINASQVRIDVSQIPPADAKAIGYTFLNAVKEFYKDPKNLKAFEDWKAMNAQS